MVEFGKLLEAEIPRVRRYAHALTRDVSRADDLVQSCLTRAIAKQHLWQPDSDMHAWLFTILHNTYVNQVRQSVREGVGVPIVETMPIFSVSPSADASLKLRDLERAIAKLSDEQRQVILLVGVEGMSYEEVALILNIPVGTVRSRLSRGREELRRLIDGEKELSPAKLAAFHASRKQVGFLKVRPNQLNGYAQTHRSAAINGTRVANKSLSPELDNAAITISASSIKVEAAGTVPEPAKPRAEIAGQKVVQTNGHPVLVSILRY